MQRSRLLAATVVVVDELGYGRTSVAHITSRARVSRRTFYDLFANREDCLLGVLDSVLDSVRGEIARAGLEGLSWRERLRGGLLVILSFFDREPALARVCVVQSLRGGQSVLDRREALLRELADTIDEGRIAGSRSRECLPLTAEGLVGAAFAIVYARLSRGEHEPLTGLLGELMGMIVLPYLGPGAARREQDRPTPPSASSPAVAIAARDGGALGMVGSGERDPLAGLPMRLTYRTARVLASIAESPGVSNRRVAEHAGVTDQGQISKLLARLQRLGLIANTGEGHTKGEPNAWTLTPTGMRVENSIRTHINDHSKAA